MGEDAESPAKSSGIVLANLRPKVQNNLSPPQIKSMKPKLGLEMRTSPTQEMQLICNCCGQPYYPDKSWEDRMRAIVFGAEKYSVCPLCTQEVPTDVFENQGYRKRCRREVVRLQQMYQTAMKAPRR